MIKYKLKDRIKITGGVRKGEHGEVIEIKLNDYSKHQLLKIYLDTLKDYWISSLETMPEPNPNTRKYQCPFCEKKFPKNYKSNYHNLAQSNFEQHINGCRYKHSQL